MYLPCGMEIEEQVPVVHLWANQSLMAIDGMVFWHNATRWRQIHASTLMETRSNGGEEESVQSNISPSSFSVKRSFQVRVEQLTENIGLLNMDLECRNDYCCSQHSSYSWCDYFWLGIKRKSNKNWTGIDNRVGIKKKKNNPVLSRQEQVDGWWI